MKWEYKSVSINVVAGHIKHTEEEEGILNSLGDDEWELLSVTPINSEGKTTCLIHHFRRGKTS